MSRPVLHLETPPLGKLMDYLAAAVVIALLLFSILVFADVPGTVPIHFDFKGQPTAQGPRWMIWILPAMTLLIFVLMQIALRYPHYGNYLVRITPINAHRQYQNAHWMLRWVRLITVCWLALIMLNKVLIINEAASQLSPLMLPLFVVALVAVILYFMIRSYKLA